MSTLWKIIIFPGNVILWLAYYMPANNGNGRAMTRRRGSQIWAFLYSIVPWGLVIFGIFGLYLHLTGQLGDVPAP